MSAPSAVKLFYALGNPVRWKVLQLLAERPHSVKELAAQANRLEHSMSKHLQVMRDAGLVVMVAGPDGDGRKLFHALPPERLRATAEGWELDFGDAVVRIQRRAAD
jgi:predicted transcriptional regulator